MFPIFRFLVLVSNFQRMVFPTNFPQHSTKVSLIFHPFLLTLTINQQSRQYPPAQRSKLQGNPAGPVRRRATNLVQETDGPRGASDFLGGPFQNFGRGPRFRPGIVLRRVRCRLL